MVRGFGLAAVLFLVGCGGSGDGSEDKAEPNVCEAGRVVECACGDGVTATQECKGDGSAWGACDCPDPSESPSLSCSVPYDQSTLNPGDRCPDNFDMYVKCDASVIKSGSCFETTFDTYCCSPG